MMKRNLLLVLVVIVGIMIIFNSTKRLLVFKTTAQKIEEAESKLEQVKEENQRLKEQLEYTKSEEFREKEVRDKLGLAKEGEAVVLLPKEDGDQLQDTGIKSSKPNYIRCRSCNFLQNYKKWWDLFFGG